jgi:hypothetical protein
MMSWRCVPALALGLFFTAPRASAILIEMKDVKNPAPIGGYLLNDDGTNLTIRVRTPDGKEQDTTYPLAKVNVLHRLDVKRLEALTKHDPKAYRDYAEELAGKKEDPEARDTAMRLYLIAGKLAPDKFGSSSMLGMSGLAGTKAEARKYRALAFLLDPKAGADLLNAEVEKPAPLDKSQEVAVKDFVRALQYYRTGQVQSARDAARKPGVDRIFARLPDKTDLKTFLQWCEDANCSNCKMIGTIYCPNCKGKGVVAAPFGQVEVCPMCKGKKIVTCPECEGTKVRDPLPDQTVRAVLKYELWAIDQLAGGEDAAPKEEAAAKGWSSVLQSGRLTPVLRLSPDTVSDFDPRKTRYRNGKWVEE